MSEAKGDNMESVFQTLKDHFTSFEQEYAKFTGKQNKAACRRARKHLMEIHKLTKQLRKALIEDCKKLPKKKKK